MDQPHNSIFSDYYTTAPDMRRPQRPVEEPAEARFSRRKFDVLYLDRAQGVCERSLMAAAHPAFERAFSVLKQGALVTSEHGMTAVEQIYPGDRLRLADGRYETVQWRGALTVNPQDIAANSPLAELTRITADAFGYSRPATDLVLGQGARILHRAPGIRKVSGSDVAFIPAADFVDGNNLIALRPTTSVTLYQFGFQGQCALDVNGIAVETLHPGSAFNLGLRADSLRAFLALFPHKTSFEDFGHNVIAAFKMLVGGLMRDTQAASHFAHTQALDTRRLDDLQGFFDTGIA